MESFKDKKEDVILKHADDALHKSIRELLIFDGEAVDRLLENAKTNKGILGQLVQLGYFGIGVNSDKKPDFEKAGIELKVSGYRKKADTSLVADQRMVLSAINYTDYALIENIESSSLLNKCKKMLMMFFEITDVTEKVDYSIEYVRLYEMLKICQGDLKIISNDFDTIVSKIKSGKAHEISESDTAYLSACRRDGSEVEYKVDGVTYQALPRRFAFKNAYISYLLNTYISTGLDFSKSVKKNRTKDIVIPRGKNFEQFVESTLKKYVGKTASKIAKLKSVDYPEFTSCSDKSKFSSLAFKMLGVNSNRAPFLAKADITIKAIRIAKNGGIEQSLSFPTFRFTDIIQEEKWTESNTYAYLAERKFLLFVFKENEKGEYVFKGYQFFALDAKDLDEYIRPVWEKTKQLIKNGFEISATKQGKKTIYTNPFPGKSENKVCHIRPHSTKSAYKLHNGTVVGDIHKDAYMLPDGQYMTKQCFWLNNSYVKEQLKEEFFL